MRARHRELEAQATERQRRELPTEPFHRQMVQELRNLQRRCAQDFKSLANRSATAAGGASATEAGAASSSSATASGGTQLQERSTLEENLRPLELETLCLRLSDGPEQDGEPPPPEILAE